MSSNVFGCIWRVYKHIISILLGIGILKHNANIFMYLVGNYKSVKSEHLNFQLGISMTQVAG